MTGKCAVVATVLTLALPGVAAAGEWRVAQSAPPQAAAQPAPAKRAKAAKTKRIPKGYGFLPGYRPPPPLWLRERVAAMSEPRYLDYWGTWRYGWGRPGFYQGRWNGGSFGPCWTQTPIGPIWNCGR